MTTTNKITSATIANKSLTIGDSITIENIKYSVEAIIARAEKMSGWDLMVCVKRPRGRKTYMFNVVAETGERSALFSL